MSKGVTREMSVRAKEQLDKQERVVERLKTKVDNTDRMLRELRIDLANEEGILNYYRAHPALAENEMVTGARSLSNEDTLWDEAPLDERVEVRS